MDLLRAMQTFVRIGDKGSLTAAADSLSISLPSVVRTLAAVEAKVDTRLLNRTTRRISLTDEGSEYLERCRRVLAEIDEAEASLSARRIAPKGRLRITAPVMFGRLRVAPAALDFVTRHPALRVDLLLLDRVVDLVEEGIDVGVRIGRLPDSSLVAIPVGEPRGVVCATASFLKRAGTPKSLAELARHRCVSFAGVSPGDAWRFAEGERVVQQPVEPVLTSNQFDVAIDACLRGHDAGSPVQRADRSPRLALALSCGDFGRSRRQWSPARAESGPGFRDLAPARSGASARACARSGPCS